MRMPSWNRRRLLPLAAVLAFALLTAGAPRSSTAATRSGHEFTYYSDATYTKVVGFQVWCRNGSHSGWGKITPYDRIQPSSC